MTTEEQERAIAKFLNKVAYTYTDESGEVRSVPSRFTTNLNAMREAEMSLNTEQLIQYMRVLDMLCNKHFPDLREKFSHLTFEAYEKASLLLAPASMRAEAFLKSLGLWSQPKPIGYSSLFLCPSCGESFFHEWEESPVMEAQCTNEKCRLMGVTPQQVVTYYEEGSPRGDVHLGASVVNYNNA